MPGKKATKTVTRRPKATMSYKITQLNTFIGQPNGAASGAFCGMTKNEINKAMFGK